jgi:hypothetical protein
MAQCMHDAHGARRRRALCACCDGRGARDEASPGAAGRPSARGVCGRASAGASGRRGDHAEAPGDAAVPGPPRGRDRSVERGRGLSHAAVDRPRGAPGWALGRSPARGGRPARGRNGPHSQRRRSGAAVQALPPTTSRSAADRHVERFVAAGRGGAGRGAAEGVLVDRLEEALERRERGIDTAEHAQTRGPQAPSRGTLPASQCLREDSSRSFSVLEHADVAEHR